MKTVICVGTSRLFAEGAASVIEQCGEGRVRASAMSSAECLHGSLTADLLIVDLPGERGLDFVRAMHEQSPGMRILALVDASHDATCRADPAVDWVAFVTCDCSAMHVSKASS